MRRIIGAPPAMIEKIIKMTEQRAYKLYQKKGHVPGNELQNWFEAEKQVEKELMIIR